MTMTLIGQLRRDGWFAQEVRNIGGYDTGTYELDDEQPANVPVYLEHDRDRGVRGHVVYAERHHERGTTIVAVVEPYVADVVAGGRCHLSPGLLSAGERRWLGAHKHTEARRSLLREVSLVEGAAQRLAPCSVAPVDVRRTKGGARLGTGDQHREVLDRAYAALHAPAHRRSTGLTIVDVGPDLVALAARQARQAAARAHVDAYLAEHGERIDAERHRREQEIEQVLGPVGRAHTRRNVGRVVRLR